MKIGFIGAGKVGFSLGKYLQNNCSQNDIEIVGYFSKSLKSAKSAADFTSTKLYINLENILKDSDTLFLTVPDSSISQIWDYMRNLDIRNKNICHCSGSISSTAFFDAQNKGAYAYSIHPLCAINDRYEAYKNLANAVFTIEGNSEHLDSLMQIFQKCGNDIIKIDTQKKALYHASAVMASNLVTALFATSIDLLNRCGVDKKMAKNILLPLLQGNVANLTTFDIKDALTGPVERNDVVTIKKHLNAFNQENLNQEKEIYKLLSQRLIEIAQSKNSLKDYSEMKEVFDSEKYSINI